MPYQINSRGLCAIRQQDSAVAGGSHALSIAGRPRRGFTLVWFLLMIVVLIGLIAIGVDWGKIKLNQFELQSAADAAALSSINRLAGGAEPMREGAIFTASVNVCDGLPVYLHPEQDVQLGKWDPGSGTFTPLADGSSDINAVRVIARRTTERENPLPLIFARILGVHSVSIEAEAIAASVSESNPLGVILLAPTGPSALQQSGSSTITIDGSLYINSSDSKALEQSSDGTIIADSFEVHGGVYQSGKGKLIGEVNTGVPRVEDPLAHLPVPNPADFVTRRTSTYSLGSGTYTLHPGRYIGGISLGDGTYNFMPGVYLIEGKGFKMGGKGTVNAYGVMIYNTGTGGTTKDADQVLISGDATINWTGIEGGPWDGMSIFQNRAVSDKKIQISGNGKTNISGNIYARTAEVQLSGNGASNLMGGGLVAFSVQFSGNGVINIGGGAGTPSSDPEMKLVR